MHPTVSIMKCEVRNANVRDTASEDEDAVELGKTLRKYRREYLYIIEASRVFEEVSLWL